MYKLDLNYDDASLFFRMDGEAAERHGLIGYLRADFSQSGREFHSTWFDQQPHLKTYAFKSEFYAVINSLRDDGQRPPFASRENLENFCVSIPGKELADRGRAYMVRTLDYSYYFRLRPCRGDYDIYCFAYDNRFLLPELAGNHDLPEECFSILPSTGELITISRNESGYCLSDSSKQNPGENRLFADTSNRIHGITRAQEEAMLAGSMFGWDTPAAKPWNYDRKGNPRQSPPITRSDER